MANEVTTDTDTETEAGETSGDTAAETKPKTDATTPAAETKAKVEFTDAQQKELNRLLAAERKKTETATAARLAEEAEQKSLEAKGETQKLLDKAKEKIAALEKQVADNALSRLRTEVGIKHKLSADATSRLKGTTADELEADAKILKKSLGTTTPEGDPIGTPAGGATGSGAASGDNKDKVREYGATYSL